ncbi:MAG: glutamyl-tRNA reductase [Actinomycetales bacterium]
MSLLALGLSHHSAPVALLERVALDVEGQAKLLADAVGSQAVAEAVVVATCNRLEVYAEVGRFHAAVDELSALLSQHTGVPLPELTPHLAVHYDERAVHHLFSVSSGLDSMVIGETQILGQVRAGLRLAQESGAAGRVLNEAFQQALRVGKRVHAETDLDHAGQSLVSVGLEAVESLLGPLSDRRVLVVGAGSMSALAATTLARSGVQDLAVLNRSPERAAALAERVGARAFGLDALPGLLSEADLVVSCTGALGHVIDTGTVIAAASPRQVYLDLAMPRDVAPEVADLPGIDVVDIARLGALLENDQRAADVVRVREIVDEEVVAFTGWLSAAEVAPTVVALRQMAERVVESELVRLAGRLPELTDSERDEVSQTVHRVVDKLLHSPTVRVKELASEPGGPTYAAALRELFDLDQQRVSALTTP